MTHQPPLLRSIAVPMACALWLTACVDAAPQIAGDFSVGPDGSASYSVAIDVPPGRAGMHPALGLAYSSAGGNGDVGIGWSLTGLSAITRCKRKLSRDGYVAPVKGRDEDALCLDGQRLVGVDGTYGRDGAEYRTTRDQFSKVVSYGRVGEGPQRFVVWHKDGRISEYGATSDSRLMLAEQGTVYKWALNQQRDRYGNHIDYRYYNGASGLGREHRITEIGYGGNVDHGAPHTRHVRFDYEHREDGLTNLVRRNRFRTTKRLSRIRMFVPSGIEAIVDELQMSEYRLEYETSPATDRSRLASLQLCVGPTAADCTSPTEFGYQDVEAGFREIKYYGQDSIGCKHLVPGDFNADGLDDLACLTGADRQARYWVDLYFGTGDSDDPLRRYETGFIYAPETGLSGPPDEVTAFDWDGDGDADLVNKSAEIWRSNGGASIDYQPIGVERHEWATQGTGHHVDLNGDARPDFIDCGIDTGEWMFRLNNRLGPAEFMDSSSSDPYLPPVSTGVRCDNLIDFGEPLLFQYRHEFKTAIALDYDGDGVAELLVARPDPEQHCASGWECPLSFHALEIRDFDTGDSELVNTGLPRHGDLIVQTSDQSLTFGDVNGDGLVDVMWAALRPAAFEEQELRDLRFYENVGGRFELMPSGAQPNGATIRALREAFAEPVDFNADGKTDFLTFQGGGSTGDFGEVETVAIVPTGSGWEVFGTGYANPASDLLQLDIGALAFGDTRNLTRAHHAAEGIPGTGTFDPDGDGLTDFYMTNFAGDVVLLLHATPGVTPDLLTEVRTGWNQDEEWFDVRERRLDNPATVLIEYSTLADNDVYEQTSCGSYPSRCMSRSMTVVKEVTHDVGGPGGRYAAEANSTVTHSYQYKGGRADVRGEGFLGFAQMAKFVPIDQTMEVKTYDVESFDPVTGTYPYRGQAVEEVILTVVSSNDYEIPEYHQRIRINEPAMRRTAGDAYFTYAQRSTYTETSSYDADAPVRYYETHIQSIDDYGNVRLVDHVDLSGHRNREHVSEYLNDEARWLIGLPMDVEVTGRYPVNSTGLMNERSRRSLHRYNSVTGVLERSIIEPGSIEHRLEVTFDRNDWGNVEAITTRPTTGAVRSTTATYDSEEMSVASVTNAKGHVERFRWDTRFGQMTSRTDANGLETTVSYDPFGRPTQLQTPHGLQANIGYERAKHEAVYGGHVSGMVTTTTWSSGQIESEATDRVGRTLAVGHTGFDGSPVFQQMGYNHRGQTTWTTPPQFLDELERRSEFSYDELGRVLESKPYGRGATTYNYLGRTTEITNARGISTRLVRDSSGRLVKKEEGFDGPDCGAATCGATTLFSYGAFGSTRTIEHEGLTTRIFSDGYGRQTSIDDPDRGVRRYYYNSFGELRQEVDGNGVPTTIEYDVLGRPLRRTTPGRSIATWEWDLERTDGVGEVAKGLLGRETHDGLSRRYEYDDRFRVATSTTQVDGESFRVGAEYDALGRLSTIKYPSRGNLPIYAHHTYNEFGHLEKVAKLRSVDFSFGFLEPVRIHDQDIWTKHKENALGMTTRELVGNGLVTESEYSPDGFLTERATGDWTSNQLGISFIANPVQSMEWDWGPHGNLQWRKNKLYDLTESFTYDELDRVRTASFDKPNLPESEYKYDQLGNLSARSFFGVTVDYDDPDHPHAATGFNGRPSFFQYDGNGDQVVRYGETIEYGMPGLPSRITDDDSEWTFQYLPDGQRVVKDGPRERVLSIEGLFERRTAADGSEKDVFLFAGGDGQAVAQVTREYTSSGFQVSERTHYPHRDHLGSPVVITDEDGAIAEIRNYDAFGAERDYLLPMLGDPSPELADFVRIGFTGHETMDPRLGLVDMGGRQFDPIAGQFITPDPVGMAMQANTFNPYAYVGNNPLAFVDPSGFQAVGISDADMPTDEEIATLCLEGCDPVGPIQEIERPPGDSGPTDYNQGTGGADRASTRQTGANTGLSDAAELALAVSDFVGGLGNALAGNLLLPDDFTPKNELAFNLGQIAGSLAGFVLDGKMILGGIATGTAGSLGGAGLAPVSGGLSLAVSAAAVGVGAAQVTAGVAGAAAHTHVLTNTIVQMSAGGSKGPYRSVKGHHVHAKAGFKNHPKYDPKEGFSISQEFMKSRGWSHKSMTSKQRELFDELASSGRPNTLREHTRIAVESLIAGGATRAEARSLVAESLWNLRAQGVKVPSHIPWN